MNRDLVVFDSAESAHSFVASLVNTLLESKQDVQMDLERAQRSDGRRRVAALQRVLTELQRLEAHLNASSRILNDLRSLRRLLLNERSLPAQNGPGMSNGSAIVEILVPPFRWTRRRGLSSKLKGDQSYLEGVGDCLPWYVRTSPALSLNSGGGIRSRKGSPVICDDV